jgi:hypothetical protein
MWYYNVNNQPTGPVDDNTIKTMLQTGVVNATTLVWQEGMTNWQTLGTTALATVLPLATTPPPAPMAYPGTAMPQAPAYPYGMTVKPAAMQIKEMNDMFMWYWICLIGILITVGLSAIASVILFYIILYRSWGLIQDGYARTTPGKAIGYCFIPFYNFYWIFQAIPGLVKDMNAYIARRNLPIQRMDEGLATTYCILTLVSVIPYVGYVTAVAAMIIQIIFLKKLKETSVAVIQYTQQ